MRCNFRIYIVAVILSFTFILPFSHTIAYGQTKKAKQQIATTKFIPMLIDIGAKQCIPCKMMAPILEKLQKDYSESIKVEFRDFWVSRDAAQKYGIRAIPIQIFYDASGREFYRHMGFMFKEQVIRVFKELGTEVRKNQTKSK